MNTDIPLARRDQILKRLEQGQSVVANSLAAEFNVSEDAIRRDLRALAAEGRCRRVYGGALPVSSTSKPMAARVGENWLRKEALARAAVEAIEPGEFIFLDAGSTNLALVDFLPEDHNLTVATNSIDIAKAVLLRGDLELILIGGSVNAEIGGCIDASAIGAVSAMNIERCFIGACALSAKSGLGASDLGDALFKRALASASRKCIALVANDKLTAKALHRITLITDLYQIVLEEDAPQTFLDELKQVDAPLLLAKAFG